MACKLLIGDDPTGMSSATGSMPESSMKLYTSCQRKGKQVKKEKSTAIKQAHQALLMVRG